MRKILSVILCAALMLAFPLHCLAEGETKSEAQTEYEETTKFNPVKTYVDYCVVPLSGQIKIDFLNKDPEVWAEINISTDNRNFEYIGTTKEDYYIINNLKNREKYYIYLITSSDEYGDYEHLCDIQSIRTK